MNQTNRLEMHLRSWAPRRPSERLEHQLFPTQQGGAMAHPLALRIDAAPRHFRLAWLAPTTMALLLMCALFGPRTSPVLLHSVYSNSIVTVALSNQSAPWPDDNSRERSNETETLESTNVGGSTSSVLSPRTLTGKISNE